MTSKRHSGSSRRTFLKTAAGVAAGTALGNADAWAQVARGAAGGSGAAAVAAAGRAARTTLNRTFTLTPAKALEWNRFKAECGPTYAGSTGWKRFTDFLLARLPEHGAVDLDFVDIPYDHYIVEDWPDRRTHEYASGMAVEKLVTDGTPVAVVASYGMTSGFTPAEGISAPLRFYDPANPLAPADLSGKIVVFETAPYPSPPYTDQFLDSYTLTDYLWRSPGTWHPLFTPPPTSVTTSYHTRWVWSQLGSFAAIAIKGGAAGMVVVYDLSPGAALGLTQRSVYTPDGKAGLGATYVNCPTLALDRVNGAKVIADAKAGRMATLTLKARFQRDTGRAIIAHLPGRNYGTSRDEQVLLATHTDAMSLIEENGGLGMLGILAYFNRLPKAERARTLTFYFDCRHFMPGGESNWPQYDYYEIHPDKLTSIVATMGIEHMGGRQTIETGPDGNRYEYSRAKPEDGGVITSLMDVHNNNIWLVETIAKAATDNQWPRVDVKAGPLEPGVNGGLQARVRSPMNRGRDYKRPGIGLAGDWPGAWTQTFAQLDTEAGPHGFDEHYFAAQTNGLAQIAGDFMTVDPRVIDLNWGTLKTALVKVADATRQKALVARYVGAFRQAEASAHADAARALAGLKTDVSAALPPESRQAAEAAIEALRSRLTQ